MGNISYIRTVVRNTAGFAAFSKHHQGAKTPSYTQNRQACVRETSPQHTPPSKTFEGILILLLPWVTFGARWLSARSRRPFVGRALALLAAVVIVVVFYRLERLTGLSVPSNKPCETCFFVTRKKTARLRLSSTPNFPNNAELSFTTSVTPLDAARVSRPILQPIAIPQRHNNTTTLCSELIQLSGFSVHTVQS